MIKKSFGFVPFFCRTFRQKCGAPLSATSTSFMPNEGSSIPLRGKKNSRAKSLNDELREEGRRNYEDTFGNIESFDAVFERVKDDPEDIREYQREKKAKGKGLDQYIKEIKSHLDNFDYDSAVKVVEVDMVNDKKPICTFAYKVLISYNAKIGNLAEAYRLFINYKRRQGRVTGAMYTSMFNACANCKNSYLALEKAAALDECIRKNKQHVINLSNYNAMMKAFGRHGDLVSCLKIMDEVMYKRDRVQSSSYAFLLQACISDKNSGLRYALLVWRKMLQNRVKPSIFSFNLMLRCIRECSLGDVHLIPNLIEEILKESEKFFRKKVQYEKVHNKTKRIVTKIPSDGSDLIVPIEDEVSKKDAETMKCNAIDVSIVNEESSIINEEASEMLSNNPLIEEAEPLNNQYNQLALVEKADDSSESVKITSNAESSLQEKEHCTSLGEANTLPNESELPNLLALKPSTGSVIEFGVMTNPQFRFLLMGGVKGFLKTMAEFQVKPDVKVFTLMLDLIPSTLDAEQELLKLAIAHKVPLDTAFFNVLMKRRFLRDEDSSVKDCLQQMHKLNLKPDLLTFGILALGCRTYESGMDLLWNVKNHGFRVNTEILGALLTRASYARDMKYVSAILQAAKENDTKLSQKFVAKLSELVKRETYLRKKEQENKSGDDELKLSSGSAATTPCEV